MSDKEQNKSVEPTTIHKVQKTEETLSVLLQKVIGDDAWNPQQVDEILAQKRQTNEYIHKERMQHHERFKILTKHNTVRFIVVIISLIMCGGALLSFRPEHLDKFMLVIISIFGGIGIKGMFNSGHEEK